MTVMSGLGAHVLVLLFAYLARTSESLASVSEVCDMHKAVNMHSACRVCLMEGCRRQSLAACCL